MSAAEILRSSALHMAVAFLGMGAWAAFANSSHPMPAALIAGLVQGALSAVLTLMMKRMMDMLSARLGGVLSLVVPPAFAILLSLVVLTSLHAMAGTPEIATTIALPLTVTAFYSVSYSLALWRSR